MFIETIQVWKVKPSKKNPDGILVKVIREKVTDRSRYIYAYEQAKINEAAERDLYEGISNTDLSFSSFLKAGPSIEACAVHDFIKGCFCPPKQKAA